MTQYDDETEALRTIQDREELRGYIEASHEHFFQERESSWRHKEVSLVIRSKIPRGEKLTYLRELSKRYWQDDREILADLEAEITRLTREIEDEQRAKVLDA